jgi:putative endonuclease
MYYVYVLKSKKDQKLYIGYSKNLRERIAKHETGQVPATKYRAPLELVYYEAYKSPRDAHKREAMLKLYSKTWVQLKKRIKDSLEWKK